jgi:hypothetical protein
MAESPLTSIMKRFGQEVVERAMLNLGVYRTVRGKKRRAVATDTLRNSLSFYYDGRSSKIQFFARGKASVYADFVEQGVNGLARNQGSPYSFRRGAGAKPAKGEMGVMQKAIYDWMKIKGIRPRNSNGSFMTFKTPEAKERAYRGLAGHLTRKIRINGISPLFYWRDAVTDTIVDFQPEFEDALNREITLVIEDNLQKKIKI